jgi:hypothetical protein
MILNSKRLHEVEGEVSGEGLEVADLLVKNSADVVRLMGRRCFHRIREGPRKVSDVAETWVF